MLSFRGTTIIGVKKDGKIVLAGDGQVTAGEHTIFKGNARKVRRIFNDKVVIGFAGSTADAFNLTEKNSNPNYFTHYKKNLIQDGIYLVMEAKTKEETTVFSKVNLNVSKISKF